MSPSVWSRTTFVPGTPVVVARIPADVGHVDVESLALPNEILRQVGAEFRPINVPVNSAYRPEGPEPIQDVDRPEVARVPNLVALAEMLENSVIQESVCVGEEPDSHSPAYAPPKVQTTFSS